MKNITVFIDEETYRIARIRAAEAGTSVSALVRDYLRSLVREGACGIGAEGLEVETERQRRRRLLERVVESIHSRGGGVRMSEILPREALHGRNALHSSPPPSAGGATPPRRGFGSPVDRGDR